VCGGGKIKRSYFGLLGGRRFADSVTYVSERKSERVSPGRKKREAVLVTKFSGDAVR
jgi:hypothetical protein